MSKLLRTSTCVLVVMLMGLTLPADGEAQRTRDATPQARVTSMKAAGSSAADIARELRRAERLTADQVRVLLQRAGFDVPTVESAIAQVYGGSDRRPTAARGAMTASPRAGTATPRGAPRPVTMSGGPTRVGPEPPRLSVQLRNVQSGTVTLDLASSDSPTVMRFANSLSELRTAPWQPYSPTASFALNGLFPAQVAVQLGKPIGPASHPVNGPHAESDPQVVRDDALMQLERHLDVRWTSAYGSYEDVPGELVVRLKEVGGARQIRVDALDLCGSGSGSGSFVPSSGSDSPSPTVAQESPGTFRLGVEGRFTGPTTDCEASFLVLGDGGNFDPGVQYSIRGRQSDFRIRSWARNSTDQPARFAYLPDFSNSNFMAPGECTMTHEGGKVTIEAVSGLVPLVCDFRSPEVLLHEVVEVTALHWKLEVFPAGKESDFHCKIGSLTRPTPGIHFAANRGTRAVTPQTTDYFFTTQGANPQLPDGIAPEVGGDLSTAKERRWILPLRAVLSCDPRESPTTNPMGDRIRLTLDRIDYRAPRGFNVMN